VGELRAPHGREQFDINGGGGRRFQQGLARSLASLFYFYSSFSFSGRALFL
jgi:hypothetical protein